MVYGVRSIYTMYLPLLNEVCLLGLSISGKKTIFPASSSSYMFRALAVAIFALDDTESRFSRLIYNNQNEPSSKTKSFCIYFQTDRKITLNRQGKWGYLILIWLLLIFAKVI